MKVFLNIFFKDEELLVILVSDSSKAFLISFNFEVFYFIYTLPTMKKKILKFWVNYNYKNNLFIKIILL